MILDSNPSRRGSLFLRVSLEPHEASFSLLSPTHLGEFLSYVSLEPHQASASWKFPSNHVRRVTGPRNHLRRAFLVLACPWACGPNLLALHSGNFLARWASLLLGPRRTPLGAFAGWWNPPFRPTARSLLGAFAGGLSPPSRPTARWGTLQTLQTLRSGLAFKTLRPSPANPFKTLRTPCLTPIQGHLGPSPVRFPAVNILVTSSCPSVNIFVDCGQALGRSERLRDSHPPPDTSVWCY